MKYKIIPYNPKLNELARKLRKQGVLSEVSLWKYLSGKKMMGYGFTRQKPIDEYIVDFYCSELYLVIEIDGSSHGDKLSEDFLRQKRLEALGLTVLRFKDSQVMNDIDAVLFTIADWLKNKKRHI